MSNGKKHNLIFIFAVSLLAAVLISYAFAGQILAKYTREDGLHSLGLDMDARFNVTFDANGGEISSPSAVSALWPSVTTDSATKIVSVGEYYGVLPELSRTGYSFTGWGASLINLGYCPVEYIESDGNAFLDLEWNPLGKNDVTVNARFSVTSDAWGVLFGSASGSDSNWFNCAVQPGRLWHHVCNSGNICEFSSPVKNTVYDYSFKYLNKTLQVRFNGTDSAVVSGLSGAVTDTTMSVMTGHYGSGHEHNLKGKLYAFSIYEGTEAVIELIPCRTAAENPADSVYGMFDLVNNNFYPSCSGKKFSGGSDTQSINGRNAVAADSVVNVAGDQEISAVWKPNTYTLTLDPGDSESKYKSNGNIAGGKLDVVYDSTYSSLPTLTRTGHTFNGWFDGAGLEYKASDKVTITEDTALTAAWTANQYTVSFDPGTGTVDAQPMPVTFGQPYGTLPEASAAGDLVFAGWSADNLPLGYRSLEYIENTGASYINTGWSPYGKSDVTIKMSASWSGSGWGVLFGAANQDDKIWFNCAMGSSSGTRIWNHVCQSGDICVTSGISANKRYDVEFHYTGEGSKASLTETVSSAGVCSTNTYSSLNNNVADNTLSIMQGHYGTAYKFPFLGKVYAFSIYEGNSLIMDLVPCSAPDGSIGMMDLVSGNFFRNIGSGSFKGGGSTVEQTMITASTPVEIVGDHVLYAVYKPAELVKE